MATRRKDCFSCLLSGKKTIKRFLKYFIEAASLLPLRRKPLFTNLEFMENTTRIFQTKKEKIFSPINFIEFRKLVIIKFAVESQV
jgi:hypothetical protein